MNHYLCLCCYYYRYMEKGPRSLSINYLQKRFQEFNGDPERFSLFTVNTGIVNHTHSRMGSIMSTGIVQGMFVLFFFFFEHSAARSAAYSILTALLRSSVPLITMFLQVYTANC